MAKKTSDSGLKQLRSAIDSAIELIGVLIEHGGLDSDEESEYADISEALNAVATGIDTAQLISRNTAVAALAKQLGKSSSDLNEIHQKAVDLKNSIDIAQKLLDGFGAITKAVAPPTPKPKSGKA